MAFLAYIVVGLQPVEAADYDIAAELNIPSLGLEADVTTLTLDNNKLDTPDAIVGSYTRAENKTLLIGHSTTVFQNLNQVELGNEISYSGNNYRVAEIKTIPKSAINMNKILAGSDKDTIIIMTCAGELLDGGDATHRLIVTAVKN